MNKGGLVVGLLLFFGIGFASAYYGSFSSFSLSDMLSSIDSSTMLLGSVFIICFALIYFALGRFFKKADGTPNTTIAAVIGLVISLFIIYGINQSDMDVQNILFDIGVSESLTQTVAPFILIFGAIFLIWRLGVDYFFLIFGALFMIVGFFTDWVYERGMVAIIGIFLLLIGLWLHRRRARAAAGGVGGPGLWGRFRNWRNPQNRAARARANLQRVQAQQQLEQIRRQAMVNRMGQYGATAGTIARMFRRNP